jgi:hypothetical protein
MGNVLDTIEAMEAAGLDAESILKAVKHLARKEAEKDGQRRKSERERKRRQRSAQPVEFTQSCQRDTAGQGGTSRDTADPSPHTPQPEPISPLKKTPKGVQKGPKIDREEVVQAFDRIWPRLPPQARRRGQEACRMALLRAVAAGAPLASVEAAVGPWLEKSDGFVERFDKWLAEGMWEAWAQDSPDEPDWQGEVELFKRFGKWRVDGPAPDEPGCLAPPEVLQRAGYHQLQVVAGGRE